MCRDPAILIFLAVTCVSALAQTPPAAEQLDAINVNADAYKPVATALPRYLSFLAAPPFPPPKFQFGMGFNFNTMGTVVVTATRTAQTPDQVAASVKIFSADALRAAPTATLDGALRAVPGFSLFRRSDSFSANPTAQGVSLRGLGPSGASRSLILLDGVPLNDPFGGWVTWSKISREGLGHAEVLPGGGATAWGNAALGGAVQIFTALSTGLGIVDRPPAPLGWVTTGSLKVAATLGDYGTRSGEVALTLPTRRGVLQVLGRDFATDGFTLVAPERRGVIDISAWSRHRWITTRWQQPLGDKVELLATARVFEEKRGNGTPYQRNGSREKFVSLAGKGHSNSENLLFTAPKFELVCSAGITSRPAR